jgi:superfamily II DNA or RNA helicase
MGGPIVARVTRPEMEKIGFIAEAIACTREFSYQIQKQVKWMPEKRQESYAVKGYLVEQETGALQDISVTVDKRKGIGEQEETCLYPDYARDMLILQAERNADIAKFVEASLGADRPVLILCEKIAQLYYLRGVLSKQLKSNIGIVHGAHSVKMRRRIVEAFESGDAPILLASTIFDEGEDIRNIGSVVLAAGGASLVRIVQRIGRGIRAKDSTRGNYCPIWLPIDHLTRYSREHTEARLNYLARAQITIEECTTDWVPFFSYLHSRYQKNVTRI